VNGTEAEVVEERLSGPELWESWPVLSEEERLEGFRMLRRPEREDFFLELASRDQAALVARLPPEQRRSWLRLLAPDDAADVIQHVAPEDRDAWLALLDEVTRRDVFALLAYAEDDAGGLMSPRFARVRPDMSVDEAITYLRKQARERVETIYYAYVLGPDQRLQGVVSFRDLFTARPAQRVADVMVRDLVVARDTMDQEEMSRLFVQHDLIAIPVLDAEGRMKGLVTVDDIVDVVQEEATEDIQRLGGSEALDAPYLAVTIPQMIRKRGIWLAALFVGELLTATAMGHFEEEIAKAVVLALFVPLIISSGGNSGSQATTLVIRAMALGEVKLRDWWRVARREVLSGLGLGLILGTLGVARILGWNAVSGIYGDHALALAITVGFTLLCVVLWGCVAGSMLPFLLRRIGLDPASASAPFVATLVDVSGLLIYFTVASFVLSGGML
jgi:magnesium transporter